MHGHPHDICVVRHSVDILQWFPVERRHLATVGVAAQNQIVSEYADDNDGKEKTLLMLT